jgi:hypothetical protein
MVSLSSLFGIGGGSRPSTQQVIQTSKLPEEIAPFAKEVLEEAKALYQQQVDDGYKAYDEDTIAAFTPEQQQAQQALAQLYGSSAPAFKDVAGITAGLGEKFTGDIAQEYMSPYQQAVTDIEKRKAMEDFSSRIMPAFEKRAIDAGGMSGLGSRAAIEASQLGGKQAERLGDIQAKGLQRAYADAQSQFQRQKERERMQAGDMLKTQAAKRASELQELGALSQVGEQKQALAQQDLDEAYYKFLEEQAYPQEKLAEYSGFVYGNPLMSQRDVVKTSPMAQGPGLGSQLLSAGMTAGRMYGMGGGFSPGGFSFGQLFGGAGAKKGGGIASLPIVYREKGGGGQSAFRRQAGEFISNIKDEQERVQQERKIREKVTPLDLLYSYFARSGPEHQKRVDIYNRSKAALETAEGDPKKAKEIIKQETTVNPEDYFPRSTEGADPNVQTGPDRMTLDERLEVLGPDLGSGGIDEGALMALGQSAKVKKPVNPLQTEGGLRDFMERRIAAQDRLGRTQLGEQSAFTTKAAQEREAAIADRASKLRGETRRRGGIFGEDFGPAAIQQLLAVTPADHPRRGLLERVMLGASAGSQALTKAQDKREEIMRDIEGDAGTARIGAKEKDLTARGLQLTKKQTLDLKKLTNKFDLEKKLAELPAENAARIQKILLSDAEFRLKEAQIKKELALAGKADRGLVIKPQDQVALNKIFKDIRTTVLPSAALSGDAMTDEARVDITRAENIATKAYLDGGGDSRKAKEVFQALYKLIVDKHSGK